MVHGAGSGHPGIIALDGLGVAVLERDGQITERGMLDARPLGLEGNHFLQLRDHIVGHLVAEALDLLGAVANAVHAHIGELTVIVVAHELGLSVEVFDDLGVQLVQLGAVGVEVTGLSLIGGPAGLGVQALLVGAQLGDGELLAVQFHQSTAVDLLVLADEGVVLFLQVQRPLVHAQHGVLHAGHAGGAQSFGQGVHMGVGEERAADLHAGVGDSRTVGVKEILLGFPVGVTGVAGVVDVGQVGGRGVIGKGAALLIVGLDNGFVAVSGSSLGGQLLALGQQSVDVGAGIGHLIEFHRERPFLSHVSPILSRLAGKRKTTKHIC